MEKVGNLSLSNQNNVIGSSLMDHKVMLVCFPEPVLHKLHDSVSVCLLILLFTIYAAATYVFASHECLLDLLEGIF